MNPQPTSLELEARGLARQMHAPPDTGATALRVAIVEDDPSQAELLGHWVRQGGHHGRHFDRGGAAIRVLDHDSFDAMVLDWNLRDISDLEVLRRIRSCESTMPILFTSARNREEDVVNALRQGADDYMIKPVRHLEFIARLEAIARRGRHLAAQAEGLKLDVYEVGDAARTLTRGGRPVRLTPKGFDLSILFLSNVGKLLSRTQICERVWGHGASVSSRTLDTHVCGIRSKLGFTPENGWCLAAKYGYGYRLQRLAEEEQERRQTAPR
jgi:two-component system response regulator RegX3